MNYDELLERGKENTEDLSGTQERFTYPDPKTFKEGTTTVLKNFSDIADALNRDRSHVRKFLNQQLGTAGKEQGEKLVFQGDFTSDDIKSRLEAYVDEYITCSECGRPDTRIVKVNRNLMLKCDACGARHPVKKRKSTPSAKKKTGLQEGQTYEMKITGTGRKGDGVAKLHNKTIFVTNAKEGDIVKAKVDNISGSMAWATAIEKID